jgi:uncharacterized protein
VEFDWDDANRRHVLRHRVEPDEAEDALLDPARIGAPVYLAHGEQRWAALAATEDGRVLLVVFTRRQPKLRVVTARCHGAREAVVSARE